MTVYILWTGSEDAEKDIVGIYSSWDKALGELQFRVTYSEWFTGESYINYDTGEAHSGVEVDGDPFVKLWIEERTVE